MLGALGFVMFILLVAGVVALFLLIAFLVALAFRAVVKRGVTAVPVSAAQLHALAEEQRRMNDRAITASEHVDLRLADLSARIDELRSQVQRILADVE